jgi:hypothetical protein
MQPSKINSRWQRIKMALVCWVAPELEEEASDLRVRQALAEKRDA